MDDKVAPGQTKNQKGSIQRVGARKGNLEGIQKHYLLVYNPLSLMIYIHLK